MITPEQIANIRRLFHAEHWKVGTIASELGLHPDTVKRALRTETFNQARALAARLSDPFRELIVATLKQYPRLRATRLFQMLRDRGYQGSISQLRRAVRELRPPTSEAFLRLSVLPGEQGQVDWASFGTVTVGRAQRRLSCFVLTLSYSRASSTIISRPSSSNDTARPSAFIPACSNSAATTISPLAPVVPLAATKRAASNAPSVIFAIPSSPLVLSPLWTDSIARPSNGAIRWRSIAAGPMIPRSLSLKPLNKSALACFHSRLIPSSVS